MGDKGHVDYSEAKACFMLIILMKRFQNPLISLLCKTELPPSFPASISQFIVKQMNNSYGHP